MDRATNKKLTKGDVVELGSGRCGIILSQTPTATLPNYVYTILVGTDKLKYTHDQKTGRWHRYGYIYAPYVPLQVVPTLPDDDA